MVTERPFIKPTQLPCLPVASLKDHLTSVLHAINHRHNDTLPVINYILNYPFAKQVMMHDIATLHYLAAKIEPSVVARQPATHWLDHIFSTDNTPRLPYLISLFPVPDAIVSSFGNLSCKPSNGNNNRIVANTLTLLPDRPSPILDRFDLLHGPDALYYPSVEQH